MSKVNSVIQQILKGKKNSVNKLSGEAFAPSNIALAKYWGKRDEELNLPWTGSISVSLDNLGSNTIVSPCFDSDVDQIFLNEVLVNPNESFHERIRNFLDNFRTDSVTSFKVNTKSNIPIAAGLASSASGFAALTLALNDLFEWNLDLSSISILSRLGSGSACRSVYNGFVEWIPGTKIDGLDSHAIQYQIKWPEFSIGIIISDSSKKKISSREAMKISVDKSPLYDSWKKFSVYSLDKIRDSILNKDFPKLGSYSEQSALNMHQVMSTSNPSIVYSNANTFKLIGDVWHAREKGIEVYFTQDAGPNLKLIFLEKDTNDLINIFPDLKVVKPFRK